MLTAVKNQIKVTLLSIKYGLMKEMLNKSSFIMNIVFMVLNNASFIIQWLILFSIRDNFGNYTLKQVLLLWGMASGTYGVSRFFFKRAFSLSDTITNGKLDSALVQPKNVLLSVITSDVEPSAIGDLLYAYIVLFIYGVTIPRFFLFTLLITAGGFILASISVIVSSLSFWINKADMIADTANSLMINFATYPDEIFKGLAKIFLFTIIPVGFTTYIPVEVLINFNAISLLKVLGIAFSTVFLAFFIFYKGLRRYSSSNLMIAKY